jgi:hypothetical protein
VTRLAALAIVVALAVSACGGFGGGPAVPEGGAAMSNATSLPVAVEVNGAWVGTYPAWTEVAGIPIERGAPPWRVMFLTPDGDPMTSIVVDADRSGMSGRWITRCGTLVVWFGERPGDALEIDPAAPRPPGPPCT